MLYSAIQQSFIEHEYYDSPDKDLARVILTTNVSTNDYRDCLIQYIPTDCTIEVAPNNTWLHIDIYSTTNEKQKKLCKVFLEEFKKREYKVHSRLEKKIN